MSLIQKPISYVPIATRNNLSLGTVVRLVVAKGKASTNHVGCILVGLSAAVVFKTDAASAGSSSE